MAGGWDQAALHQANMVRDWLEYIFEERMQVIMAMRGDSFPTYSLDMNHCDSLM
jgi:hypothetical protein